MIEIAWLVLPGLVAAAATLAITPLVARLAVLVGAVDLPGDRKIHHEPIPRLGGVGVVLSIAATLAWASWLSGGRWQAPTHLLVGIGFGVLPILTISIADDIRSVRASTKFLAHLLGAATAVSLGISLAPVVHLFGYEVHIGWLAGPLSILWMLGVTNAFNLIDGLDGLSTGLALIAAVSMALVFALVGQWGMAGSSLVLAGALFGFLPYNIHPARLFLGDSGATAIGFCLAAFALRGGSTLSTGLAVLLPVLILGLPLADMVITVLRRTLHRLEYHTGSIFDPDRNHIHHRLLALGVHHHHAVLTLYGAAVAFAATALISLFLSAREAALLVVALLGAGLVAVHRLGYDEFALFRRGTVLKVYELRTVKRGFFIILVDIGFVFVAASLSVGLKTDVWTPGATGASAFEIAVILAPITVAVFWLCQMYRDSWRVAGLQDLTRVAIASSIATLAGASCLLLLSPSEYSPSLFVIYGIVSLLLTASSRASYVILQHTTLRSSHRGEPVLIYGAGRRGAAAARELFSNQALNLRPVGFIDDDPSKRGRIVTGLPVFGPGRDLEHTLATTGSASILISSGKIAIHHLDRATEACRRTGAKLFHLDLGVHRIDREDERGQPSPVPAHARMHPRAAGAFTAVEGGPHLDSQTCPSCTTSLARRSRARNVFERFRKLRTDKRLYRCDACGWRGWLTPLEVGTPLNIDSSMSLSFDVPLSDLVEHAHEPFAPLVLGELRRSRGAPS